MARDQNLKEIGEELIALANDRGGEDNISLVILQHTSTPGGGTR